MAGTGSYAQYWRICVRWRTDHAAPLSAQCGNGREGTHTPGKPVARYGGPRIAEAVL